MGCCGVIQRAHYEEIDEAISINQLIIAVKNKCQEATKEYQDIKNALPDLMNYTPTDKSKVKIILFIFKDYRYKNVHKKMSIFRKIYSIIKRLYRNNGKETFDIASYFN